MTMSHALREAAKDIAAATIVGLPLGMAFVVIGVAPALAINTITRRIERSRKQREDVPPMVGIVTKEAFLALQSVDYNDKKSASYPLISYSCQRRDGDHVLARKVGHSACREIEKNLITLKKDGKIGGDFNESNLECLARYNDASQTTNVKITYNPELSQRGIKERFAAFQKTLGERLVGNQFNGIADHIQEVADRSVRRYDNKLGRTVKAAAEEMERDAVKVLKSLPLDETKPQAPSTLSTYRRAAKNTGIIEKDREFEDQAERMTCDDLFGNLSWRKQLRDSALACIAVRDQKEIKTELISIPRNIRT